MSNPTVRRTRLVGTALAGAAAIGAVVIGAGPAAAHAGVSASNPRALAKNVTITFHSEAESDTAGIAKLQVALPAGISVGEVSLGKAPKGWKFAQAQGGYILGGKPLAVGVDAVYSIVVKQLPDAKSLVFKTVETYGDGKIARWIEEPRGGAKLENPAPVLKLKSPTPGSTPKSGVAPATESPVTSESQGTPAPSATPGAPASATPGADGQVDTQAAAKPKPKSGDSDSDGKGGTVLLIVLGGVAVVVIGVIIWLVKRRSQAVR
ncbi:DUF1775 domain-containing protein [Streptomyces sp. CAU 1734]|uniref:DUF1775 domain-containing protein n=1 Tax=Streptomyces sp. CAU 1734 TaxID=3140360 RepID=UPI003260A6B0